MFTDNKKLKTMFLLFTIAGCYWSFTGFLLRSAVSYDQAYFFQKIGGLWPFCIAIFAHFAIIYINLLKNFKRKIISFSILYVPAVFFSFFEITTDQISLITRSTLGFWTSTIPINSNLYLISTIWSWSVSSIAIVLVLYYLFKINDKKEKIRTKYVLLGLSTPVLLSTTTESILPLLSLPTIKMTVPGFGIGLIFIGYAIYKYDLFQINPRIAADKIIENMKDFMILTDNERKIHTINPAVINMLGYNENELIGKKIDKLFSIGKIDENYGFFDLNNEFDHKDIEILNKKGDRIPVDISKTIIKDETSSQNGLLFIGRDISFQEETNRKIKDYIKQLENGEIAMVSMLEDLKNSKSEIEKLNQELKQKVYDRTEEVEKLLKQKDEFIGQLGHDLKTPLTPLNTLLPIIRNKTKDEKLRELVDVSIKNSNYMKNLVIKTLELARLNSPNTDFNILNLNLNDIIRNIIENNKTVFKKQNVEVENKIKNEIFVKADQLRLEEVLNNLIINAVKYTKQEAKIIINAEEKKDYVTISIKDNGIGMTNEQLSNVFNEFYKTDKSRSDFSSTGLGLPICKRIIEKHGGKIWAESPGIGKGSTFYFTLKKSKTIN